MKQWMCIKCWHEVYSDIRQPMSIHWSDGHVCTFKSPEDINTDDVTSLDTLIRNLKDGGVDISNGNFPEENLKVAYHEEVKFMLRYGLQAERPKLILDHFRLSGSQWIANFEVRDLEKKDIPTQINFHMQNTSQWVYAGCILYDQRDNRVSRHH